METAESFRENLGSLISNGHTSIFIAVGYELKLFDILGKFDQPKTSQEIADASDCKEEFIRAWLHLMVTAKIVDMVLHEGDTLFFLPKHRVQSLKSTEANLGGTTKLLSMYAACSGDIVKGFKKDSKGGIKHEQMKQFFSHYEMENNKKYSPSFLREIIAQVPGLKTKLEKGIKVCDLGCGSGNYVNMLAKMYPKSKVIGIDLTDEILAPGRKQAETMGLKNASFQTGSAENLPAVWIEYLDYCTVTNAVHHLEDPMKMMTGVYKALKPGGIFSIFDSNIHNELQDNIGKWTAIPLYAFKLISTGMDHGHGHGHGHGHAHGHGHTVGHKKAHGHGHVAPKHDAATHAKGRRGSHGADVKSHDEQHDSAGAGHVAGRRGSHGGETQGHVDNSHDATGTGHGKARRVSHGDKSHDPHKHVESHAKGHKGSHGAADAHKGKKETGHDDAKKEESAEANSKEVSAVEENQPRFYNPHEGHGITMGMEVPMELLKKAGFIPNDPVPVPETMNIHIVAFKPNVKKD
ncbi:uncharacterized protein LOC106181318 [Lingula anatina]|uniref:Uncharacterized protein LOC106181318 n=1 Tax=Lingula anatina TaxID=7574 RepID=A0A1S3KF82_LINAN|nr:uncharacterized protein LOC106181318 [Lingula anatina]|eukprot:XP_013421114.1 uncharacterized protein LOC106181318 [Lingula anatina]